ncbi:hypothetical protein NDU88_011248, partial [Pleurodeles waltl]
ETEKESESERSRWTMTPRDSGTETDGRKQERDTPRQSERAQGGSDTPALGSKKQE